LAFSSGNAVFQTLATRLDLPLRSTDRSELGLDLQARTVDAASFIDLEEYEAMAALVYMRSSL
jgi:hypothetical protein